MNFFPQTRKLTKNEPSTFVLGSLVADVLTFNIKSDNVFNPTYFLFIFFGKIQCQRPKGKKIKTTPKSYVSTQHLSSLILKENTIQPNYHQKMKSLLNYQLPN